MADFEETLMNVGSMKDANLNGANLQKARHTASSLPPPPFLHAATILGTSMDFPGSSRPKKATSPARRFEALT